MGIVLYSTNCPKCNVLKAKLNSKNIPYVEITDVDTIRAKGIMSIPYLEVDNKLMDFTNAVAWINQTNDINTF